MSALQVMRSWLRYPSISQLALSPQIITVAQTLVLYVYVVLPYLAFVFFQSRDLFLLKQNLDLTWPLYWATYFLVDLPTMVDIIGFLFLITSLLGVLYFRYTVVRLVVCIGFWQAHALQSSFGEISHQWLGWLGVYFIFIFLPNIWDSPLKTVESNKKFLLVVWWSQAMVMWIYSMAGLGKVLAGFHQMFLGQINSFSISAFSYQVAEWLPKNQQEALWGPFIIEHPLVGWFLYIGSIYFQFFALWVMVRPSLQKIWAFELILFHIGTTLTMGVSFTPFVLLLGLLFFNSPFGRNTTIKEMLFDVPIFGQCIEWLMKHKKFQLLS